MGARRRGPGRGVDGRGIVIIRPWSDGTLRFITQHDHARFSGDMARAWRGFDDADEPLDSDAILATALHDFPWVPADRKLLATGDPFDDTAGRPHDFLSMPSSDKALVYQTGLDRMEDIGPWVALLVSRHLGAFLSRDVAPDFRRGEDARQQRLCEQLGIDDDDPVAQRQLALLRLFDLISLYVCLSGAGIDDESLPGWLQPPFSFDGHALRAQWQDTRTVELAPWPFDVPRIERPLPFVAIPLPRDGHFGSREAFVAVAREATDGTWPVCLVAG